ncbi:MAG: 30S ribosome-binding factor RbfA [Desulfobacterales bacterium]|nr:30S ribosome-binding factor RbfA [Desulfobacterales bacterium]
MLAGKRAVRVGDLLLREIADLLMKKVNDPRVKGITLSGVHVNKDLKHARVYYTLIGDERDILDVQSGLDSAKGFIKREIALRTELKYVPDVVFKHDPSLERGEHFEKLFRKIKAEESSEDRD